MYTRRHCVAAVDARGDWPELRPLEGIVCSPTLRPDGSILCEAGYDAATGLYYVPHGERIELIPNPTWDDARKACSALLEVVRDFPFASDGHRAAWLALVLTPLAWHAFYGPAPLHLIDANTRGSGKSLLADVAALSRAGEKRRARRRRQTITKPASASRQSQWLGTRSSSSTTSRANWAAHLWMPRSRPLVGRIGYSAAPKSWKCH